MLDHCVLRSDALIDHITNAMVKCHFKSIILSFGRLNSFFDAHNGCDMRKRRWWFQNTRDSDVVWSFYQINYPCPFAWWCSPCCLICNAMMFRLCCKKLSLTMIQRDVFHFMARSRKPKANYQSIEVRGCPFFHCYFIILRGLLSGLKFWLDLLKQIVIGTVLCYQNRK